ncbi:acyl-CoA dehydrogenase family protein [Congregibacter sp.]|uniref:acyl-CoA dehydrogenase family protein n=1 Tax=Congregibacter sp. TaxID=2744308 RepID=UPI003F6D0B5D
MAQPKNYGFEEEAGMLKDGARRFFAEKLPVDQLHALVADAYVPERAPEVKWRKELWDEMVALGWTALAVPESAGGVGLPWVAVAALLEESGRAAFPSPLLSTLQATAVLTACGDAGEPALTAIAEGCAATIAVMDASGSASPGAVQVIDGKLEGTAYFVQDAGKCDHVLVVGRDGDVPALFWVSMSEAGVAVTQDAIIDLTRDQARLSFSGVTAQRIDTDAAVAWETAQPTIWMLSSADMVGAAEWLLQTTVEYAQQRKQFDRSLGFFQAVKHDLVNVMTAIDESKSLLYNAACALDHEPERARELAHMAKSSASDTAAFASGRTVQMHGGIGFTWECYVHLYFKRQKHSQLLWGDAAWHRAALAELLVDRTAIGAAA